MNTTTLRNLSMLAVTELSGMLKTAPSMTANVGDLVKTGTPVGGGGTQELMDADIIEFVSDSGLVTTYRLSAGFATLFPGALPAVNKVKIVHDDILINGERVGYIGGTRSEVWLSATTPANPHGFVARFKYASPRTKARAFVKAVFSRIGMDDYLRLLAVSRSPHDAAMSIGANY